MLKTTLATMRVTSDTTLDQLKAFQETIGKDDAKLRGTKNRDGSITLKAVDRDSSFLSKMFGISARSAGSSRSPWVLGIRGGSADRSLKLITRRGVFVQGGDGALDLVAFAKAILTSSSPGKASQRCPAASSPRLRPWASTARVDNVKLACDLHPGCR